MNGWGLTQESAGNSGEASSSHWSNFEVLEGSRDKEKYEYMGDRVRGGEHTRSASHKSAQPTNTVGIGKRNHARSARGRQARECYKECKI